MSDLVPDDPSEFVGDVWLDVENGEMVFVVELLEELAGEYVVTYNYDTSPKFVSDFESNEDYSEEDRVVDAVYVDSISDGVDVDDLSVSQVEELVENREVKLYQLPVSRLGVV